MYTQAPKIHNMTHECLSELYLHTFHIAFTATFTSVFMPVTPELHSPEPELATMLTMPEQEIIRRSHALLKM